MTSDNLAIGFGLDQDCVTLSKREVALTWLSGILQRPVSVSIYVYYSQEITDPFHAVSGGYLTNFIRIIKDFEVGCISEFCEIQSIRVSEGEEDWVYYLSCQSRSRSRVCRQPLQHCSDLDQSANQLARMLSRYQLRHM
jgi:hypothetical protein